MQKVKEILTGKIITYLLFGGYNTVFILFILLLGGFIPGLLLEPLIPLDTKAILSLILLVPFISLLLLLIKGFRPNHKKVLKFFFGVEIPIILLAILRLIFVREVTPIWTFFLFSIVVSIIGYTILLFYENKESKLKNTLLSLSQEISVITSGYFALLALFFAPIVLAILAKLIFHLISSLFSTYLFWDILRAGANLLLLAPFVIPGVILFIFTFGFFAVTPFISATLYIKSFKQQLKFLPKSKITGSVFAAVFILTGLLLSLQPNINNHMSAYEKIKTEKNFEKRLVLVSTLMQKAPELKDAFVYNTLAKYKFLGDNKINFIKEGYKKQLNMPSALAKQLQNTFNKLALPFIYQENFKTQHKKATEAYEYIFDNDIQEGERSIITKVLKSINTRDEIKAGLLNKDQKKVRIISKNIEVEQSPTSPYIKVSIEEEYQNLTYSRQEVYYEFSLPQGAVISNLLLGPNLEYQGVISPKGAARRTYENQVRRRVDPALLEQTGPRQYRLKVFPIEPNIFDNPMWKWDDNRRIEPNQKVKYEYIVVDSENILPQITEKRNVFEDKKTKITYKTNGKAVKEIKLENKSISNTLFTKIADKFVYFSPEKVNIKDLAGKNIAFLLDSSYSSKNINWNKYFEKNFKRQYLNEDNNIDVYFFNDLLSQKHKIDENLSNLNFGRTDRINAIKNLPHKYDAIFMFTDSGAYDIENKTPIATEADTPIFLIHVDNIIPQFNDKLTSLIIKSGGKVFKNASIAISYYEKIQSLPQRDLIVDANEYGIWYISDTPLDFKQIKNLDNDKFFKIEASSKVIRKLIQNLDLSKLENLEKIHAVSKQYSIVSPYSSFIALVNSRQEKELKEAEKQNNKFEAGFDLGKEAIDAPSGEGLLNVPAVPEPEEWIMIFIALAVLILLYYKKQIPIKS